MQTVVNSTLANGVVGEAYDASVGVIDSYILASDTVTNVIGYAFTTADGVSAACGGTDEFAGILVNPKQYANYNISLGATREVVEGIQASISKSGRYWVDLGGVGAYGASVYYVNATGALGAGTATTGQTQIANCKVIIPATSNGLAVIEIFNQGV